MNFLEVRYRFDDPSEHGLADVSISVSPETSQGRAKLLAEAVQITPAIFPNLAGQLSDLSTSMMLDDEVDCFVISQPVIQAFCITHSRVGRHRYSVVLSSAMVERLEPEEIRFVVGHEVGHHLCGHWRYPVPDQNPGLGHRLAALQLSRAAEISADRIGMLACRSLDSACAAMIKVASGLGAPHIKPDIPSFLHQFRQLSQDEGLSEGIWMTHPILPLRVRALLRFEPIFRAILEEQENWHDDLQQIDNAIESDFHRSTGQALHRLTDDYLESVRCWGLVYLFCADGVISKIEQRILEDTLGKERASKILRFLRSQTGSPNAAVESKLADAATDARQAPLAQREELVDEFETLVEEAGIGDASIETAMQHLRTVLTGKEPP